MADSYDIATFLPGRLVLSRGSARDYRQLERFHYRPGRPATWADVWAVRYFPAARPERAELVAVAVLSYPTLALRVREQAFGLSHLSQQDKIRFVNAHLRTISRVAVHPTFRSMGLAVTLVKCLIAHCPTRYIEAMAVMGRAHPFFAVAGMRAIVPDGDEGPVYYLSDRSQSPAA